MDEVVYGGIIFGPKIGGAFLQNLNFNFDALTIDRWNMRTWGRLTGTLLDPKSETGIKDAPTANYQRKFMKETYAQAIEILQKNGHELETADAQASLWYPEKLLYTTLGREREDDAPTSYGREMVAYVEQAQRRADAERAQSGGRRAGRGAPAPGVPAGASAGAAENPDIVKSPKRRQGPVTVELTGGSLTFPDPETALQKLNDKVERYRALAACLGR
jgi:hypothetical protein